MLCFQLLICIFKKLWRELSGLQCLYSLSCLLHLVTLSLLFIHVCECLGNMLRYRRGSALRETLTTSDDLAMGNMSSRSGNDLLRSTGDHLTRFASINSTLQCMKSSKATGRSFCYGDCHVMPMLSLLWNIYSVPQKAQLPLDH